MDPPAAAQLLSLCKVSDGDNPYERVLHANGFVFLHPPPDDFIGHASLLDLINDDDVVPEESGVEHRRTAIFAQISRVNHSCEPNAVGEWHERDGLRIRHLRGR